MGRPVIRVSAGPLALLLLAAALGCGRADPSSGSAGDPSGNAPGPAAGTDAGATSAAAAALPRIVFLGDSLTAGLGIAKEQAVPALIQQRLRDEGFAYEVVNAGVSGDTSAGGLTRLDWSLAGDVDVLVLELGANDGLRGIAPARTRENLQTIIRTARQRGIDVLLTGMEAPPNYGPAYTSEFRKTFRDLASSEGVAFMPFFLDGVAGVPRLNQADGIHPTPEGARIVADNLWHHLKPLLHKTES